MIEFAMDGIYINDQHGEIVSWIEDEWKEDPEIVFSMMNAMRIYYEEGPDALRKIIGKDIE